MGWHGLLCLTGQLLGINAFLPTQSPRSQRALTVSLDMKAMAAALFNAPGHDRPKLPCLRAPGLDLPTRGTLWGLWGQFVLGWGCWSFWAKLLWGQPCPGPGSSSVGSCPCAWLGSSLCCPDIPTGIPSAASPHPELSDRAAGSWQAQGRFCSRHWGQVFPRQC